jgi:hypothetical protein
VLCSHVSDRQVTRPDADASRSRFVGAWVQPVSATGWSSCPDRGGGRGEVGPSRDL